MAIIEIVIPFYNEAHRLGTTLEGLTTAMARSDWPVRFWWVDDGSTDGSVEELRTHIAKVGQSREHASHEILIIKENVGKGAAIRHALSELQKKIDPEAIVGFWDSDGELEAPGIIEACQLIVTGRADVVFGSRFSKRNDQVLNFRHYLGNKLLTLISNWFSNLNLSDVHCCARFLRAKHLFKLPLTSNGFDFEAEFVGLIGRVRVPKLRLAEVPLTYIPRTVDEGKKIGIMHVLPQLRVAIACRYFRSTIRLV